MLSEEGYSCALIVGVVRFSMVSEHALFKCA